MKKISTYLLQILIIFICYLLTHLLVLGSKTVLISKENKLVGQLFQILILPTTWLWVNLIYGKIIPLNRLIFKKINFRDFFIKLIIAFFTVFFVILITIYYLEFFFKIFWNFEFGDADLNNCAILFLLTFSLAFSEELIFRKLILNLTLNLTNNVYVNASINGLLFFIMHLLSFDFENFEFIYAFGLFFFAFFLTIYVIKFKDLFFPVCLHLFWNLTTDLITEGDKFKIINFTDFLKNKEFIDNTLTLIFTISIIILSLLIIIFDNKKINMVNTK